MEPVRFLVQYLQERFNWSFIKDDAISTKPNHPAKDVPDVPASKCLLICPQLD
jgi:hypothetical protein